MSEQRYHPAGNWLGRLATRVARGINGRRFEEDEATTETWCIHRAPGPPVPLVGLVARRPDLRAVGRGQGAPRGNAATVPGPRRARPLRRDPSRLRECRNGLATAVRRA